MLAFDHVRKEIWLVVTADVSSGSASAAYSRATKRLDKLERRLEKPLPHPERRQPHSRGKLKVRHRTAKKDFIAAVARTKEYIRAGDAFQVVISQRLDVEPGVDSFQVYRALRTVNPSPYMFFLRFAPDGAECDSQNTPGESIVKGSRDHLNGSSWPARRLSFWCGSTMVRSNTGPLPARVLAAPTRPKTTNSKKK